MRDRVKRYFYDYKRAFDNLEFGVLNSKDDLDIDGTIKRFELCYELSWKLIKSFLEDLGFVCKSPRECFKYAFQNDLINDEDIWLKMIDDRNLLVHTYKPEDSRKIFDNIKNHYLNCFKLLLKTIKGKNV